ncbi:MAG: FecR domain-containing protein [Nitrospirota bacterium]|nr:FecR domain-containing protein [Nitrospirota bacterium]
MKHMKTIVMVIMIMLIMIPVSAKAEGLGNARLSLSDGDVQIRSEDSSEWLPAAVNMPLRDGDSIWVPDGARAEVQLAGGTQVRLDELSSLDLLNISRDSSQFYLAEGSAYVNFRGGRSSSLVQIDTPVSSIRAYDRTAFNVDVAGSGDTDVSVYKGLVHAESGSGSTRVTAGNVLEISDDYADLAPLGRADAWERWNTDRDRRFEERSYSSRYLPDELETYASDFDHNGRWVSVRDYGYVWTPTVQVSVGWSPYRNGRWSWIGRDYVWVGYEPWGWAPYHYGRWAFSPSVGWFWVPPARGSVFWGPGYVGWVRTPTYVAWVPLAPRETYYGHGNYGPHSVNIINVNINTIVVKNRYKNVYATNGVTVVHHDNFVRGKHLDFKVRENPFLSEKIHIGRPDIKPERESRMAVIRDIPRAKEPPKKIREIKIREIKEARPMVREREKSVFSPDRLRKQMKVQAVEAPRERKRDRLEERSKDRDRTLKGSERQQIEERKKEVAPAEKRGSSEPDGRQQDRRGLTPKEKEIGTGNTTPVVQPLQKREQRQPEQQIQQPEQPKQEVKKPERPVKREYTAPQGMPEQPKVRQKESEPVQDRQIQREERKQKQQEKQPDKEDIKQDKKQVKQKEKEEKRKKVQEEKDAAKHSGEGSQQPSERAAPAVR